MKIYFVKEILKILMVESVTVVVNQHEVNDEANGEVNGEEEKSGEEKSGEEKNGGEKSGEEKNLYHVLGIFFLVNEILISRSVFLEILIFFLEILNKISIWVVESCDNLWPSDPVVHIENMYLDYSLAFVFHEPTQSPFLNRENQNHSIHVMHPQHPVHHPFQ